MSSSRGFSVELNENQHMIEMNVLHLGDCMEYMSELPDKYFELAIVDPPYGDGIGKDINGLVGGRNEKWLKNKRSRFGGKFDKYEINQTPVEKTGYSDDTRHWDIAPPPEYFSELARVSKNQIIWGGNYFDLPSTRCFIVYQKLNIPENFSMAMCEYAWTSFNANAKIFAFNAQDPMRFHPTQKPIGLYKKCLQHFAEKGDKILDTHAGSASSLIACYEMGFDYVGIEIDPTYHQKATKRLEQVTAQIRLEI